MPGAMVAMVLLALDSFFLAMAVSLKMDLFALPGQSKVFLRGDFVLLSQQDQRTL